MAWPARTRAFPAGSQDQKIPGLQPDQKANRMAYAEELARAFLTISLYKRDISQIPIPWIGWKIYVRENPSTKNFYGTFDEKSSRWIILAMRVEGRTLLPAALTAVPVIFGRWLEPGTTSPASGEKRTMKRSGVSTFVAAGQCACSVGICRSSVWLTST